MKKFKWTTAHPARRCGHHWCTECRTRRGHNRGNRRVRHTIRQLLRSNVKGEVR